MPIFTTQQIAQAVGGDLAGSGEIIISGLDQIENAKPGDLTFIGSDKYGKLWPQSKASAALVTRKFAAAVPPREGAALILVNNADLAMATILELFTPPAPTGGMIAPTTTPHGTVVPSIHPTAIIDPSAHLGVGCIIGAYCIIGPHVVIDARTVLYPHVTVLDHCTIGEDCVIWPGTVIRERCTMGHRCILHANVNIGADGFGYRPAADGKGYTKIPQIGTVEIGDDVEMGAGCCVDRGKFAATVIGDGCKFDNMVQIAHNCQIGKHVIIAGQAGVAGSSTVGDGAIIGGRAGISDHVHIAGGGVVMAASGVMRDVEPGQRVLGIPARDSRQYFREQAALAKLPELLKELRKKDE